MKYFMKPVIISLISIIFIFIADSQASVKSFQVKAGEEGLLLKYNLKRMGNYSISIAPGDPETELSLSGILGQFVSLRIKVDSITAEPDKGQPPTVNAIIIVYIENTPPFEFPMSIPFGDYGFEFDSLYPRLLNPKNSIIEILLFCGLTKTQYDINVELEPVIKDKWEGNVTFRNNTIIEEVVLGKKRYVINIIPVRNVGFTLMAYYIDVFDGDELLTYQRGFIPIPNGSYQIWFNPGYDITEMIPLPSDSGDEDSY